MKRLLPIVLLLLVILVSACVPNQPSDKAADASVPAATLEPAPDWLSVPVTDALTGKKFSVSDLKGKVVLMEGMATWCPTCWAQSLELKKLKQELNAGDSFVIISLALDTKEDAVVLQEFAKSGGLDWYFVTSSVDMYRDIGNRYGATYLDPTLVPLFIVDKNGHVQHFKQGRMSAKDLQAKLQPLLDETS